MLEGNIESIARSIKEQSSANNMNNIEQDPSSLSEKHGEKIGKIKKIYKEENLLNEASIIKSICKTVANNSNSLNITPDEASALLTSLINKDQLLERIKKIRIDREPYRLEYNSRFQKYFEVVGHNGIIERICYDNGTKFAFTGGADGAIKCWSIIDGLLIRSLYGHTNMISDLCISKNGEYMVSVDYQGLMNIWSLKDFTIIHSIQFTSEAIFCEFIYPPNSSKSSLGNIFIIFSDGLVKLVEFNLKSITAKLANSFMYGESIKAICITDGGRFVICGGWWPFFLIYDTCDLNKIIVAENFRIQTLCAAKNALKFAASSENRIHIYTFFSEGSPLMGNYSKKKSGEGHWKRTVNEIDSEYFVEWICFLPSYLLVAACTDSIIRLYEDDSLVLSFAGESGSIFSHPFKNIFAVVGTNLSIYQIVIKNKYSEFQDSDSGNDCFKLSHLSEEELRFKITNSRPDSFHIEKLFEEMIHVNLNDCQFSDDGRFFIACDDQGIIKTYSIEVPIEVPEHQFFMKDIDRDLPNENFTETFNIYRQKNTNWNKLDYQTSEATIPLKCIQIENQAAKTLEKDKLTEEKFKSIYLAGDSAEPQRNNEDAPRTSFPMIIGSDRDETYIISDDTESGSATATSNSSFCETSSNSIKTLSKGSENSSRSRRRSKKSRMLRGFKSTKSARRIINTDDESLPKESNKRRRTLVSSESDESPIIVSRPRLRSSGNFESSRTSSPKRILRRNLTEDSLSSDPEIVTGRVLRRDLRNSSILRSENLSSDDTKRHKRKASVSNKLGNLSLDSSFIYSDVSGNPSASRSSNSSLTAISRKNNRYVYSAQTADFKAKNHLRSHGKSLNESSNNFEFDYKSESNLSVDSRNARILRKNLKSLDNSHSLKESTGRVLRRSLPVTKYYDDVELESESAGIDEIFEKTLADFAYSWISSCSIYPGTKVYFNRESYEEFMELEQRIKFSKKYPMISGFYDVTVAHVEFIGKIPYLILAFGSLYLIKVYEFPSSKGIICTSDQKLLEIGQSINYFKSSKLVDGVISEQDEMFLTVDNSKILKSLALVKYESLEFAQIPYSSVLRPLFNLSRSNKFTLKPITNFEIINMKLKSDFYKNGSDLIFDLKVVSKAALEISETAKNVTDELILEYENAIDEK